MAVLQLLRDGDDLPRPQRQGQLIAGQIADGGLVGGDGVGQTGQLGQGGHAPGQPGGLLAQAQLEARAQRDRIDGVGARAGGQQRHRHCRGHAPRGDHTTERL